MIDHISMQGLKLLAATAIVFAGGWLLILSNGVLLALKGEHHPDWYPVPPHAIARLVTILTVAIGLQFVSAWIMMPSSVKTNPGYWRRYATRVALCICGCFAAVVMIAVISALFCSDC